MWEINEPNGSGGERGQNVKVSPNGRLLFRNEALLTKIIPQILSLPYTPQEVRLHLREKSRVSLRGV